jgi:hypothetical protein
MFATAPKSTCDGHIFHENTITSAVYLDMLENFLFPQIVAEVNCLNFQQDGAPACFGAIVRTAVDERFPDPWIGKGGPIIWTSRSPDLSMGFFWEYIIVYSGRIETLPALSRKITVAVASVPVDVLSRVWCGVSFRRL